MAERYMVGVQVGGSRLLLATGRFDIIGNDKPQTRVPCFTPYPHKAKVWADMDGAVTFVQRNDVKDRELMIVVQ